MQSKRGCTVGIDQSQERNRQGIFLSLLKSKTTKASCLLCLIYLTFPRLEKTHRGRRTPRPRPRRPLRLTQKGTSFWTCLMKEREAIAKAACRIQPLSKLPYAYYTTTQYLKIINKRSQFSRQNMNIFILNFEYSRQLSYLEIC